MRIQAQQLSLAYGTRAALHEVSFSIGCGELVEVLGPNGSGKSTLFRCMLGLEPAGGRCLFDGAPYRRLASPSRRIGVALDPDAWHPGLTAAQQLVHAGARRTEVGGLLELVGLSGAEPLRPKQLSLGMKQRLALAVALVGDPEVLILDEPTNGLDAHGIDWLSGLLREFVDAGKAVLLSTHALNVVDGLVDRVLLLNDGRLVDDRAVGTGDRPWQAIVVKSTDIGALATALTSVGGVVEILPTGGLRVSGLSRDRTAAVAAAAPGVLTELRAARGEVEDAYFGLMEGALRR